MARLFIQVPPDQVDAVISSVPESVQPLARVLISGGPTGGGGGTGFIDFLLTSAQETFQEKTQVIETLTDTYVAFYAGQTSPVFSYGGTVLNTYQDDQRVWLFQMYREILRGTRLANRNLFANLRYDSFIVSGYLEGLNLSLTGDTEMAGQFTFQMRVKRMGVVTPIISSPTIVTSAASETSLLEDASSITAAVIAARPAVVASAPAPPTATVGPAAGGTPGGATHDSAVDDAVTDATNENAIWQQRLSTAIRVLRESDAEISVPSTSILAGILGGRGLTAETLRSLIDSNNFDLTTEAGRANLVEVENLARIANAEEAARRRVAAETEGNEVNDANPTAAQPVDTYNYPIFM
jgi:hypothetical protein